jgi:hypothetical protein
MATPMTIFWLLLPDTASLAAALVLRAADFAAGGLAARAAGAGLGPDADLSRLATTEPALMSTVGALIHTVPTRQADPAVRTTNPGATHRFRRIATYCARWSVAALLPRLAAGAVESSTAARLVSGAAAISADLFRCGIATQIAGARVHASTSGGSGTVRNTCPIATRFAGSAALVPALAPPARAGCAALSGTGANLIWLATGPRTTDRPDPGTAAGGAVRSVARRSRRIAAGKGSVRVVHALPVPAGKVSAIAYVVRQIGSRRAAGHSSDEKRRSGEQASPRLTAQVRAQDDRTAGRP